MRVLFYYGTIIEKCQNNVFVRPEFYNIYKTLQAATQLDPYNEDTYYFVQAAFNWELERTREVNSVLEYGMKYRTWDLLATLSMQVLITLISSRTTTRPHSTCNARQKFPQTLFTAG